jgi:nucleoside-diphosphate-sugar epimerase
MPATSLTQRGICLVTGTGGYLGGCVKRALDLRGWQVIGLTRQPRPGSSDVRFQLGHEVASADLAGAQALVHCAYDFKALSWKAIQATNVAGSEKLLQAARQAGVERLVCISSISAYDGCRSLYGKAKLAIESIAHSLGAVVIRPGLIYGDPPAGMFGRLVRQVEGARVLPLFGGGSQVQYLVHDQDLSDCICRAVEAPKAFGAYVPITIAHEQPWTFRQILEEIARAKGRRISFVPVPWRLVWAMLRLGELCHLPLDFRSDSLVSLMYQNPSPAFGPQRELGFTCRPFRFVEPKPQ